MRAEGGVLVTTLISGVMEDNPEDDLGLLGQVDPGPPLGVLKTFNP